MALSRQADRPVVPRAAAAAAVFAVAAGVAALLRRMRPASAGGLWGLGADDDGPAVGEAPQRAAAHRSGSLSQDPKAAANSAAPSAEDASHPHVA